MKPQITLHTRLNSSIYESHGGGQDVIVDTWNIGPANLLKAVDALREKIRSNIRGYGNIGCGRSWLEIDGESFDPFELNTELQYEQYIRADKYARRAPLGRIQVAKKYI